jgi:glycosyltransferase involved in cell wall biosynthesis
MILIDCLYINNGGGKVLLDYLVPQLEKQNKDIFYLFDKRCENDFKTIPEERKVYLEPSLISRLKFYKKNKNRFIKVLCFGNIPPVIKLNATVYTYFHQPMFLNIPKEFHFTQRLIFHLKIAVLKMNLENSDFWMVQHNFMKQGLVRKFNLKPNTVLTYPFYPNEDLEISTDKSEENSFIYVSSGAAHKNHLRLIDSFCAFYDKSKLGKLILTVDKKTYPTLCVYIYEKVKAGYPIENIGFVSRESLITYYKNAEYLVFPSLEESFGLGIVEAIECGCKVIGADLPYMHQVCQPSILFNPFINKEIEKAFYLASIKKENKTIKKIDNKIDELISLLK